ATAKPLSGVRIPARSKALLLCQEYALCAPAIAEPWPPAKVHCRSPFDRSSGSVRTEQVSWEDCPLGISPTPVLLHTTACLLTACHLATRLRIYRPIALRAQRGAPDL